jgi:hypothetical protein
MEYLANDLILISASDTVVGDDETRFNSYVTWSHSVTDWMPASLPRFSASLEAPSFILQGRGLYHEDAALGGPPHDAVLATTPQSSRCFFILVTEICSDLLQYELPRIKLVMSRCTCLQGRVTNGL